MLPPKENFTLDPFLLSMGQDINSFEGDEETIENERNEVLSHEDIYMDVSLTISRNEKNILGKWR